MPYTDVRGRPEIIADPGLKAAPAAVRVIAPGDPAGQAARDAADADADAG
jgi:hypothetical protein